MRRTRSRPGLIPRITALTVPVCVALASCGAPQQAIEIPFSVQFGAEPISCSMAAADLRLSDMRLFVYDFHLTSASGEEVALTLDDRPPWQGGQVALLDFEDGTGTCRNGSAATNAGVQARVAAGNYTGLRFRIGVPEVLNHADPLQALAPLNHTAMHWHWLTGYKFLRAGIARAGIDNESATFWLHLGSTRCSGSASDPGGCRHSNRPEISLPEFVPEETVVVIDLAPLAAVTGLHDGISADCSSGPTEASCERPFAIFGLDFASGDAIGTPDLIRVTKLE
ncbi:MAG: MbnP family copper-binding protein [Woeseia sp.]